ncbi:hypothetical protein HDV06_001132 [Boothiomyces sp. JEL0866]|nr:hypothetical protein HDV06_001132 [Boothiomyces sp. JEL0866]
MFDFFDKEKIEVNCDTINQSLNDVKQIINNSFVLHILIKKIFLEKNINVSDLQKINKNVYEIINIVLIHLEKIISNDNFKNIDIKKASDLYHTGGMITGAAIASLGPTALMTLATSIGVTASGTAISSLTGAAATSAALAWLGGGAIIEGGLGMVGGLQLLAAVPVIGLVIFGIAGALFTNKKLTEKNIQLANQFILICKLKEENIYLMERYNKLKNIYDDYGINNNLIILIKELYLFFLENKDLISYKENILKNISNEIIISNKNNSYTDTLKNEYEKLFFEISTLKKENDKYKFKSLEDNISKYVNGLKLKIIKTDKILIFGDKGSGKSTYLWLLNEIDEPPVNNVTDSTVEFLYTNNFIDTVGINTKCIDHYYKLFTLLIYKGWPKDIILSLDDRPLAKNSQICYLEKFKLTNFMFFKLDYSHIYRQIDNGKNKSDLVANDVFILNKMSQVEINNFNLQPVSHIFKEVIELSNDRKLKNLNQINHYLFLNCDYYYYDKEFNGEDIIHTTLTKYIYVYDKYFKNNNEKNDADFINCEELEIEKLSLI